MTRKTSSAKNGSKLLPLQQVAIVQEPIMATGQHMSKTTIHEKDQNIMRPRVDVPDNYRGWRTNIEVHQK